MLRFFCVCLLFFSVFFFLAKGKGRAREALSLLLMPPAEDTKDNEKKPIPAINFFDQKEIYPGNRFLSLKFV